MPRFRTYFPWLAFLVPSGLFSAWLFLWLQWLFPLEDLIEPAFMNVLNIWLVALCLGVGFCAARTVRARLLLTVLVLLLAASTIKSWSGPILDFREPRVVIGVTAFVMMMAATVFLLGRWLMGHAPEGWRVPFTMALLPLIFIVSTFGSADNSYKWCWPWTSWQPAFSALAADTAAEFARLGLPRDRALTPAESELWAREGPPELTLRFPIIGKP